MDDTIEHIADEPRLIPEAASWFSDKWDVPASAYVESMEESCRAPHGVPQWFVVRDHETLGMPIIAGCGIIENDFHDRSDLAPNLCALYVEEPYRGRGLARQLLDHACAEACRMGYETLYLITDHDSFYEKCGWRHVGFANEEGGGKVRVYAAETSPERLSSPNA